MTNWWCSIRSSLMWYTFCRMALCAFVVSCHKQYQLMVSSVTFFGLIWLHIDVSTVHFISSDRSVLSDIDMQMIFSSRMMSRTTVPKDVSLALYNWKSMDNKLMAFPSSTGSTFTFVWHLTLLCRKSTVEAHLLQRISPRKRNQVMP